MKENKEHIIAKWLEGNISDVELNTQYDADMNDDLKLIIDTTDTMEVPPMDSSKVLSNIKADIAQANTVEPVQAKVFHLKYWVSGIAAILIGLLAFTTLMNNEVVVSNNTLAYTTHQLPDGSNIKINANTRLDYDDNFLDDRTLTLDGEAFFEVEKGSTFTVLTDNGNVTVLGTSFNVFTRGENLLVACKTGKVKVSTDRDYILGPGDKIAYRKNSVSEKSTMAINDIASWSNGKSIFESSPLSIVVEALSAQYNVTINNTKVDLSQKFTGSFVHDDLDKALRMVFLPMEVSYQLDSKNKVVTIQ